MRLISIFESTNREAAKTPPTHTWVVGGGGLEAASRICGSNNKELGVRIEPNGQKARFLDPTREETFFYNTPRSNMQKRNEN